MKKKLLIAAISILLLAVVCFPSFAQTETQITVTPDKATVYPGEEVTFTVQVSGSSVFTSLGYIPYYDTDVYELISAQVLTTDHALADFDLTSGGGVVLFAEAAAHSGDFFRFTVKIKDNAPLGAFSTAYKVSVMNNTSAVAHALEQATVTVVCNHDWSAATCTTPKTCSLCNATEGEAAGHKYNAVVTKPTCTEGGYTTYTCSTCSNTYIDNKIDATGHSYDTVVTKPTCTEGGYTTYTCSACSDTYVDNRVSATGHSYGTVVTKPTCTEGGYTTYTCSTCSDTYVDNRVSATGHSWSDATCTAPKTCSVCNATEGNALGHNYNEWAKTDETQHNKTCSICGDVKLENHIYENDLCTICGDHAIWSYTITASKVTITGYTGSATEIEFPETLEGLSVTAVANNAFSGVTLTKVLYSGRSSAWNTITVGSGNEALTNALVCLGDIRYAGTTLTLHNSLTVDYWVDSTLFTEKGFTNPYIVFDFMDKQITLTEYTISGQYYIFSFRNVATNFMNETISASVHATYDGTDYAGNIQEYSVATYCYNQLERYPNNVKLRTLLVDLLNYGALSQQYTKYKTNELVNAKLTATQKAWGTTSAPALESVKNSSYKTVADPQATWLGTNLVLESSIVINAYFSASDIQDMSVTFTVDEQTWTITSDAFKKSGNMYYVEFDGLHAGQMSSALDMTIYRGTTAVSNTFRYSIESYAYQKQNDTSIAYLSALVNAMMNYGKSAYAYTH